MNVGMRVVCIRDDWKSLNGPMSVKTSVPVKGKIYTVRDTLNHLGVPFIHLEEIINPQVWNGNKMMEPWFQGSFFRPIDETKLDQFRKHLVPVKQLETVR